ncbi:MAG: hypothetical protein QGI83_17460 [Candidatus Latescibacteria bacterium]|jgi:hypothetical protein|nr:hypothetical protein [Candidatus Latescibacterota bacterium]
MQTDRKEARLLGITVLADFILNEGVDGVLKNVVERAGATAVACNPTVTAEAEEGKGSFQPPSDAGSSKRLFDRPLWGKHSLWVRGAPSYHPNRSFYEDTPYEPREPNELTDAHGALVGEFIDAALDRGLKVYLQTGSVQPPGLREDDVPRLPDGRLPEARMANTGSLASEAIRAYNRAYIRDLLATYPQITGLRPDWPEYPCYKLDEAFQDFGPHVHLWAAHNGFDFEAVRQEVAAFYAHLHGGLTNADLHDFASAGRGTTSLISLLRRYPGVLEWLRLKAALSCDTLHTLRSALTEWDGAEKELSANAFMPPFSLFTGFDFGGAAEHCVAVSPKLYTMHWSVMVQFWGEVLLQKNPGLDERLVVRALANLFDLGDAITAERISDYGYPAPDEPHPIPDAPQHRKIEEAIADTRGRAQVTPIVHGYGPLDDFSRRIRVVAESEADGVWINRYGYLSDEKLDAVGEIWAKGKT